MTGSNGRVLRGATTLMAGTALSQAVLVFLSPILTRLYTPADFGLLAVYSSILVIVGSVAALRYDLAIPLPKEDEAGRSLLALSMIAVTGTSIAVAATLYFWSQPILGLLNAGQLQPYVWLLPLGILGYGYYQALSHWAIRKRAYSHLARTTITRGAGQVATQLTIGLLHMNPLGLLVGQLVGQIVGNGSLARLAWGKRVKAPSTTVESLIDVGIRYRRFPMLSTVSGLLNSTRQQLPALLLVSFYGLQVAGWFALAQRVLGVPIYVISSALSQVYLGEVPRLVHNNPAALRGIYVRTAVRLLALVLVPAIAIVVGGPWLFTQVFGSAWGETGTYVQILAVPFVAQFVFAPLSQTLNVLERQDLMLILSACRLGLVCSGLATAGVLHLTPVTAVAAYSASTVLGHLITFGTTLYVVNGLARKGWVVAKDYPDAVRITDYQDA